MLSNESAAGPFVDFQLRFESGKIWHHMDLATRINTPEELTRNSVIALPWMPDKGDLIVHNVTLIRGEQNIDLLQNGQRFTVLRRESSLEQREITGILTGTLEVEGLQVGDILRIRASITNKDPVLGGRVQWSAPVVALPTKVSGANLRFSWPASERIQWKVLGNALESRQSSEGPYQVLTVTLPAPRQPEMPADAPMRFRRPPSVEVTSFTDWRDVSQVMAPLYQTANAIPGGSAVGAEVSRIVAAETEPVKRAALALRSVQDKIRYLAVGMDGGNYVPQSPEKTWSVRYGDCKAKTLLLLAMLHAMKIEAEPVLASVGLDDLVSGGTPRVSAFNHILVRAKIAGVSYWLDGTGSGTRLPDIGDTPPFRTVLPVRRDGAELETISWAPPARPSMELNLAIDESGSVDLPSVVDAALSLRGQYANALSLAAGQLGAKEKQELIHSILSSQLGEAQIDGASMAVDAEAGTVTLKGQMVTSTPWRLVDRRHKRNLSLAIGRIQFAPDRARSAWSSIPVSIGFPDRAQWSARIRLPEQGRGFALEGLAGATSEKIAGYTIQRTVGLANGIAEVSEALTLDGMEVPAEALPVEKRNLARGEAQQPRLIAPADTLRRWELPGAAARASTQASAIERIYAARIAEAAPEDVDALTSRASYRRGTGNFKGAIDDLGLALAKAPSAETYVIRGRLASEMGDMNAAAADAEAALKLEPGSVDAISLLAEAEAERGNLSRALALLDELIALGGEDRSDLTLTKAQLIGDHGEPRDGIRLLDELLAEKPGTPEILNAMCWIRGTRSIELDVALKNCTSAIELSTDTSGILDSRALVWMRLGRYEDALRDLDAALLQAPALGPSRYLRSLVLAKLGRDAEAKRELIFSRQLSPSIERKYARYGLGR